MKVSSRTPPIKYSLEMTLEILSTLSRMTWLWGPTDTYLCLSLVWWMASNAAGSKIRVPRHSRGIVGVVVHNPVFEMETSPLERTIGLVNNTIGTPLTRAGQTLVNELQYIAVKLFY